LWHLLIHRHSGEAEIIVRSDILAGMDGFRGVTMT